MNDVLLNTHKRILEGRQNELSAALRNWDGIAIERPPDTLDEVQQAREREIAVWNLDRDSVLLRNVSAALARIEDGSYGICMNCDEEIKPKRLEAVPWAKYCIRCQEDADRHKFDGRHSLHGSELLAA
jgi:DnaK suppressor protein